MNSGEISPDLAQQTTMKRNFKVSSAVQQLLSLLLLFSTGVMRRLGMPAESCVLLAGARSGNTETSDVGEVGIKLAVS